MRLSKYLGSNKQIPNVISKIEYLDTIPDPPKSATNFFESKDFDALKLFDLNEPRKSKANLFLKGKSPEFSSAQSTSFPTERRKPRGSAEFVIKEFAKGSLKHERFDQRLVDIKGIAKKLENESLGELSSPTSPLFTLVPYKPVVDKVDKEKTFTDSLQDITTPFKAYTTNRSRFSIIIPTKNDLTQKEDPSGTIKKKFLITEVNSSRDAVNTSSSLNYLDTNRLGVKRNSLYQSERCNTAKDQNFSAVPTIEDEIDGLLVAKSLYGSYLEKSYRPNSMHIAGPQTSSKKKKNSKSHIFNDPQTVKVRQTHEWRKKIFKKPQNRVKSEVPNEQLKAFRKTSLSGLRIAL